MASENTNQNASTLLSKTKRTDIKISDIKYDSGLMLINSQDTRRRISENIDEKKKFLDNIFKLQKKSDITHTILDLEKSNDVYIFKKPKLLHKITIKSHQPREMQIIHPSGTSSPISLTSSRSSDLNKKEYEIEYQPETICIGFSISKDSEILNSLMIDVNEALKNSGNMLESVTLSEQQIKEQELLINKNNEKIQQQEEKTIKASNEIRLLQEHKNQLEKMLKEQEKTIQSLEKSKERLIKENDEIELRAITTRNSIEITKEKNEELIKIALDKENSISILTGDLTELNKEIEKLRIEKNQFDNELSGYSNEGARQSKAYYAIAFLIMIIISLITIYIITNGISFIENYHSNNNANIIELILSRIPLTIGISITLTFSFALTYIMIKNIIKINSDRMKFLQASIIAKDIYYATENTEGLTIQERERMRQEAKIKIISRIFENEQNSKIDSKIAERILDKLTTNS